MKKTNNKTSLRIKFMPCTNTRGARLKITQLNSNKSCFIGYSSMTWIQGILENLKEITSFSQIVDNTQTKYFDFVVDTEGKNFPDLITLIKEVTKW